MTLQLPRLRFLLPSILNGVSRAAVTPLTATLSHPVSLRVLSLASPFQSPISSFSSIWSLIPLLWESILRAVPKKKSTHARTRSRQLAGKALKDVTALNTCSGCGRIKKMHTLCPHCVQSVREMLREQAKSDSTEPKEQPK